MGTVTAGWCSFREIIPGPGKGTIKVECYLGRRPPRVISGYSIWEQITRPKRKSITEWQGLEPLRIELEIIIDYFASTVPQPGLKCERDMRNLEILAGASERNQRAKRAPLVVWDANMMHDNRVAPHVWWVIDELEWTDLVFSDQALPNIVRAEARVVLMEWVEDQYIRQSGAKKHRAKKHKSPNTGRKLRKNEYRVTLADTQKQGLKTIAKKRLGDAKRWREIAKIQKPPIRDPMAIRPDQILKIPKK